jgi:hypothetical protein
MGVLMMVGTGGESGSVRAATALELHAHHLLPRQFAREFATAGITDLDKYIVAVPRELHILLPNGLHPKTAFNWNGRWQEFLRGHDRTAREIEMFATQLWRDFLDWLPR